jgi:hypothetical protein
VVVGMNSQVQTSQVQTQNQDQDQTMPLEKLVKKLEVLGRVEELRSIVKMLRSFATELKYYVSRDPSMFIIKNVLGMTDISIVGRYTDCVYFDTSIDPKSTTIYDVFDKFFNANIYANALRCIADALNDLANIIDSALPELEDP